MRSALWEMYTVLSYVLSKPKKVFSELSQDNCKKNKQGDNWIFSSTFCLIWYDFTLLYWIRLYLIPLDVIAHTWSSNASCTLKEKKTTSTELQNNNNQIMVVLFSTPHDFTRGRNFKLFDISTRWQPTGVQHSLRTSTLSPNCLNSKFPDF